MTAVYVAWCGLVEVQEGLIARVAASYGVKPDRLLRSSLLCVALHDIGKLSRNFQDMMRARDEAEYRAAVDRNYRHEVAPLWLITRAAEALIKEAGGIPGDGLLETLAVAGHHKFLAGDHLFDEDRFRQPLAWEPSTEAAVMAACGLAQEMFHAQGWRFPALRLNSNDDREKWLTHKPGSKVEGKSPFNWLLATSNRLTKLESARGGHLRALFVLLKGLLMTADWMASGAKGRDDDLDARKGVVRADPGLLLDHLRERIEGRRRSRPGLKLKPFGGYTTFQARCGAAEGHVVAIAPTGGGKTEASWLWALNQVERDHARKVFVLLPTMVTANSIHERLAAFLREHDHGVGLVHSTADLVRQSREVDDESDQAVVRVDLGETHFFRPVTVGTVDQLLVPLFHSGRWAMKTMAAASAAIIIDEVHAYEPHTLGLIHLMIRQLAPLGTRFMIMSATMPVSLVNLLRGALEPKDAGEPGLAIIQDDELLDSARNVWEAHDTPLTDWLVRRHDDGRTSPSTGFLGLWGRRNERGEPLKILIVVNTVRRCQDLARALREFNPVCYHSKFIFDDRRDKERRINDSPPRLLIATQVVEVSLDIDYDVLLTECAPIDALIQRAGRVNRSRREARGRIFVHPPEQGSDVIYGQPRVLLERSWKICLDLHGTAPTERKLTEMVELAYEGHDPSASEEFGEAQSVTLGLQSGLAGVLDAPKPHEIDALAKTRKESYLQMSVIPALFEEAALAGPIGERKRYELKVPVWYARKHKVQADDIPICPMGYGAELGAELIASLEHPEPNQLIY